MWTLATLKLATLFIEKGGNRSRLVPILSKHEFMPENHIPGQFEPNMNKSPKYVNKTRRQAWHRVRR